MTALSVPVQEAWSPLHLPDESAPIPLDLARLDRILDEFTNQPDQVIPILQRTQDSFGYLKREALRYISEKTLVPLNELYGVATFYKQFRLEPQGQHRVRVCDGTSCHICGSSRNIDAVSSALGIEPGQTTADRRFTLEIVHCLGCCALSPVALVDERVYGRVSPEKLVERLKVLD